MSFKDYSLSPSDNHALSDGTYIGPDMLRNKVRPALQQLASDGADLYNVYAGISLGSIPFRATFDEAIADFDVGEYFMSNASGLLRVYKRTSTTPFYVDQGDTAAPLTYPALAGADAASHIGKTGGGSVQDALDDLDLTAAKWGTQDLGTVAAGTTFDVDKETTVAADSGGTTDFRAVGNTLTLTGTNPAQQIIANQHRVQAYHPSGNVTFLYGYQGFIRVNLAGETYAGTVTAARGFEHHIAVEGDGSIDTAMDFYAQGVDLNDGTGAIDTMSGFRCADQGHATRVTTLAAGFHCNNFTAGAPTTVAFLSEMSSGSGKFAFRASGSAASTFNGACRFGDLNSPTDKLEVAATAKANFFGKVGMALSNYANDAAAATGGVAVGELYRNGSVVMIRVA